jgi:hypothetical protein
MKLPALALLALTLSGCAVNTLTIDTAKKYQEMTIGRFLVARFDDSFSSKRGNSIVYEAHYTGSNYSALLKPMTDVKAFCLAKNGEPYQMKDVDPDFVARYFPSSPLMGVQARIAAKSIGMSEAGAARAGQYLAEENDQRNLALDLAGATKGFSRAADEGAFGNLGCKLPGDQSWAVRFAPSAYAPAAGTMSSHKLFIQITIGKY